ncbi:FecR family protein [Mucilaginibacter sp. UR6-11]|uniref:FecR family protein n=1 Tax=Mucilaginibacter sp. UR6-11 TaxID=1435644 RepID=UPI001E4EF876|nr:FecR family protein [Mucilaginibacter sp. UR6-11]MCC8425949.1 DUF4974 domain-containing protein [Mucilaginibacter sp. UR6-11]
MERKQATEILARYRAGTATEQEKVLIEDWLLHGAAGPFDLSEDELLADLLAVRRRLARDLPKKRIIPLWARIAAAASVLVIISLGAYRLLRGEQRPQLAAAILPGSNKAVLTLANGQRIYLNDAKSGALVQTAGIKVIKDKKGQITYVVEKQGPNQLVQYNTTTTPKGGQWHLVLADGTNVWLNAASSLYYPTAFAGKERIVRLTGEGYFEVTKDKTHPFIVQTADENIRVLGTHFNVNTYTNEPSVKTTLLEGSVQVEHGERSVFIKPGEQAVLTNDSLKVKEADTEEVTSWKDGLFIFNDESLESIMRKVARWYDVEIVYRGVSPKKTFWGGVSRYEHVEQLLHKLELTKGVHFKIEGRRIIATP